MDRRTQKTKANKKKTNKPPYSLHHADLAILHAVISATRERGPPTYRKIGEKVHTETGTPLSCFKIRHHVNHLVKQGLLTLKDDCYPSKISINSNTHEGITCLLGSDGKEYYAKA